MITTWYAIVSFMLIVYVALDGRNFGAGMLHWVVARTPEERRQVIEAIGPLWAWHEVWLVAFGGTLVAVFPQLIASAFAGYYLALFLILWCLILRGIAIEFGGHINDRLWQNFWDFILVFANFLLAILFGVAAGNLARGVPLDANGNFSMAFFTNFRVKGYVGLLDWYTTSVARLRRYYPRRSWCDLSHGEDRRPRVSPQCNVGKAALGSGCSASCSDLDRVVGGSPRRARARDSQSILLARIAHHYRVDNRAGFGNFGSTGDVDPCWFKCSPGGFAGDWSGGYFPGNAFLDARTREFTDCLRCCFQPQGIGSGLGLVACGSCSGDYLFHRHLTALCRESRRQA